MLLTCYTSFHFLLCLDIVHKAFMQYKNGVKFSADFLTDVHLWQNSVKKQFSNPIKIDYSDGPQRFVNV